MNLRDKWQPVDREEWKRRLRDARAMAVARLAANGLDLSHDGPELPSIAALILELPLGAALVPSLAETQATIAASIRTLKNPRLPDVDGEREPLSDQVF